MLRILLIIALVYLGVRALRALAAVRPREEPYSRKRAPKVSSRSPYEVLGVSSSASAEEIRAAYQMKMRENHPDRVVGMSQEIRDIAEQRTKEINGAYERLRKEWA